MYGAFMRSFIEHTPMSVAMFDTEMRYLAASARWIRDFQIGGPVIGRSHYEIFPDLPERWKEAHRRSLAGEMVSESQDHFKRPDGSTIWTRWITQPWRQPNGAIGGILIIVEDVTGQKRAEEALRESEERYRYAMDAVSDGIWDWRIQTGQSFASPSYFRMLGYEGTKFPSGVDSQWLQLMHPDDRNWAPDLARKKLTTDGAYELEFRLRARDGSYRWIMSRGKVVERDATGAPTRAVGTHVDITERKRAEEALRQSEQRLRLAEAAANIGVWDWDILTDTASVNDEFRRLLGIPERAPVSYKYFLSLVHEEDRESYDSIMQAALAQTGVIDAELRIRRPDNGETHWVVSKGQINFDEHRRPVRGVGAIYDITDRKRAEAATLKKSEDRYRRIVEAAGEGIWLIDAEGKTTFVNTTMAEMLGYAVEEMTGRSLLDFMDEEWRVLCEENLRRGTTGVSEKLDFKFRRKDGSELWVLIGTYPIFEDGVYTGALGMISDNTERKRLDEEKSAHLQQLEEGVRRKNEFIATLGHELRTPLAGIRYAVDLVLMRDETAPGAQEKNRSALRRALNKIDHVEALVADLLQVARVAEGKIELNRETLDLADVLPQAVDLVDLEIKSKQHELHINLPPEPLLVHGDAVRLVQVFGNLLDNACKYTDAGGRIDVTAAREGGDAVVTVRDNGVGILAKDLPWIFQIFAQIKHDTGRARGGIGIGLALVRSLVELHGGRVEAHSEGLGRGSAFIVRLPLMSHDANSVSGFRKDS